MKKSLLLLCAIFLGVSLSMVPAVKADIVDFFLTVEWDEDDFDVIDMSDPLYNPTDPRFDANVFSIAPYDGSTTVHLRVNTDGAVFFPAGNGRLHDFFGYFDVTLASPPHTFGTAIWDNSDIVLTLDGPDSVQAALWTDTDITVENPSRVSFRMLGAGDGLVADFYSGPRLGTPYTTIAILRHFDLGERFAEEFYEYIRVRENSAPIADADGPYLALEGSLITFDASASSDPEGDELQYRWDFNADGIWDTAWNTSPYAGYTYFDDYYGTVHLEVSDGDLTQTDTADVEVDNVAPTVTIDAVNAPFSVILPNDVLTFTGSFTDPGSLDTHAINWEFGDAWTATGTLTPTHAYADAGIYWVTLSVEDDDGGTGISAPVIVTVLTATEATEELISGIEDLGIHGGTENSLTKKLENAIKSLEKGNVKAAVNQLEAFIAEVEAQRGKKLTDEEADALIEAAERIIETAAG